MKDNFFIQVKWALHYFRNVQNRYHSIHCHLAKERVSYIVHYLTVTVPKTGHIVYT